MGVSGCPSDDYATTKRFEQKRKVEVERDGLIYVKLLYIPHAALRQFMVPVDG